MSIRQRLYPDPGQQSVMLVHCAQARFVFNLGLAQRSMWTKDKRHYAQKVNLATQMRELSQLRAELDWLRAGSSVVQQGALRDLDRAFTNFFARRAGYPNFRRKNDGRGSFAVRDVRVRRLGRKWGVVSVPKVGTVRFRITRDWTDIAVATSARVTLTGGHWHVAFTTTPPVRIVAGTGEVTGIDRGVANSIAAADGAMSHAPGWSKGEQTRYLALQRRLARQVKGSNRRRATKTQLGVLHRRLSNRRTDWVEQTTTTLARRYDLVGIEKLNTPGMTKRPKPTPDPDHPGAYLRNGARAKAGLNKAILASCWGKFATRLGQKMPEGHVVAVDPRYTSQQCNACGHTAPGNRESQAVFCCTQCGHSGHADTNAARNILDRAITAQAQAAQQDQAGSPPATGKPVTPPIGAGVCGGTRRERTRKPRPGNRRAASTTPKAQVTP